jgi:hypothetical protein
MGQIIHARMTEYGIRYRQWSTGADAYIDAPLTYEEMYEILLDGHRFRLDQLVLVQSKEILFDAEGMSIQTGSIGRIDADFTRRCGTFRVRWGDAPSRWTEHSVRDHEQSQRIADERIFILGSLTSECPESRLARATENGTSAIDQSSITRASVYGKWETERCSECSLFHHEFKTREDGSCWSCGEPESDSGHKPPCKG